MKTLLSKSQFIRGLQCRKSLWLYRNRPELRTPPDEAQQVIFTTGTEVGLLAQKLFPGGSAIKFEEGTFEEKTTRTRGLIDAGTKTIYEATFLYDDILVMVDILHHGVRGWELYEVKSSTEVKDVHVNDVAVQYYVLTGSGLPVAKASLVHINNQYVRAGALDVKSLFAIAELTSAAEELQDSVRHDVRNMQAMLGYDCPVVDIGPHCSDPYECDFTAHCWAHIPKPSVFDLSRLNSNRKFELYYKGVCSFKEIPEDCHLNPSQWMQVKAELENTEFIDKAGIVEFLNTLRYPLYFLDFETFQSAIPLFDGTRPYEQIPSQYSLHSYLDEDRELNHAEFLSQQGRDSRESLIKRLIADISPNACVLAYNMTFEKMVINNLAEQFPTYADRLMNIHDNMLDLMAPFRSKYYYTKAMQGSYSIKYILPALIPGMSYEGMAICNGGEAMNAYATLHLVKDEAVVARIRKDLLEYCKLDTLAMVFILDKLKKQAFIDKMPAKKRTLVTNESIFSCPDGAEIQITAKISGVRIKQTNTCGNMAIVSIESVKGPIEAIIFPFTYYQSRSILEEGKVVTMTGRIDDGRPDSGFKIIVENNDIK